MARSELEMLLVTMVVGGALVVGLLHWLFNMAAEWESRRRKR